LRLKLVQRRHLFAARRAPGRPEIDQERLAGQIGERHRRAVGIVEAEIAERARRIGRQHRRNLAADRFIDAGNRFLAAGQDASVLAVVSAVLPDCVAITYTPNAPIAMPATAASAMIFRAGRFIPAFDIPDSLRGPRTMTSRDKASNQMWGGRFASGPDAIMEEINASIGFDKKLYAQDIRGSMAHATMLAAKGIFRGEDKDKIVEGLNTILSEIESGQFEFSRKLEDIHMNVEARLAALIGSAAGRLHTARSRNDQVALDFRLWVKEELQQDRTYADRPDRRLPRPSRRARRYRHARLHPSADGAAGDLRPSLHGLCRNVRPRPAARAPRHRSTWTKARSAPPPLPAPGFPIDRHMTAEALGFREPTRNSIDTVSDRDFALEFLSIAAICATHLSRLAEEIVIWSTPQFGFIRLSDAFSTGSSIMPQKKNPDAAELVRAKTGRINGSLIALLTVMKGLPLAYSKDMQEDKEQVFDAAEHLELAIAAMTGMVRDMTIRADRMRAAPGPATRPRPILPTGWCERRACRSATPIT
jgi:argininosuccinate lyase